MHIRKQNKGHLITGVQAGSIAEELHIEPGDRLLEINGHGIEDVFDYRFDIQDEALDVLIRKQSGEEWLLDIEKEECEDLGIEFETGLMSDFRSCRNKCIFCFIDQMPSGMRESLYFKDDDSRLSFMQGNYITLTNMTERDIDRIIRMHLAPINISVQTTNPALRCKMLHNRFAGSSLKYMDRLHEHGIEMNGQIVLCKGVNDGEELARTIRDLERYIPSMRSVSIVPAGLTRFREGLYPLSLFSAEEAGAVIDCVEAWQRRFYEKYGLHFVHASDEFYSLAGRDVPEEARYDGYLQLGNGVGMVRLLFEEVTRELARLAGSGAADRSVRRTVTIATGRMIAGFIEQLCGRITALFPGVTAQVVAIENRFFGETITVTGLITGQDLIAQLRQMQQEGRSLGERLLISANMLRTGERVFLDDLTVDDAERALGLPVCPVDAGGADFVRAILDPAYEMTRANDEFVYIDADGGRQ